MTVKQRLYDLIEDLPEAELLMAERYLQDLRDRAAGLPRVLREAESDDEPVTEEDLAAIAEAQADLAAGRVVSHQEMRREFGWSPGGSSGPTAAAGHAAARAPNRPARRPGRATPGRDGTRRCQAPSESGTSHLAPARG